MLSKKISKPNEAVPERKVLGEISNQITNGPMMIRDSEQKIYGKEKEFKEDCLVKPPPCPVTDLISNLVVTRT